MIRSIARSLAKFNFKLHLKRVTIFERLKLSRDRITQESSYCYFAFRPDLDLCKESVLVLLDSVSESAAYHSGKCLTKLVSLLVRVCKVFLGSSLTLNLYCSVVAGA